MWTHCLLKIKCRIWKEKKTSVTNFHTSFDFLVLLKVEIKHFYYFFINRNPDEGEVGGELMLGGYDTDFFEGELQWVPLKLKAYWLVQMDGYVVCPISDNIAMCYKLIIKSTVYFFRFIYYWNTYENFSNKNNFFHKIQ